jgi:hypothetical protein
MDSIRGELVKDYISLAISRPSLSLSSFLELLHALHRHSAPPSLQVYQILPTSITMQFTISAVAALFVAVASAYVYQTLEFMCFANSDQSKRHLCHHHQARMPYRHARRRYGDPLRRPSPLMRGRQQRHQANHHQHVRRHGRLPRQRDKLGWHARVHWCGRKDCC